MTPLSLYYFDGCPFCDRVRRTLQELGVQVELRDIWADDVARAELAAARGRTTVPVLRIHGADGDEWMPESRDIVAYLQTNRTTAERRHANV